MIYMSRTKLRILHYFIERENIFLRRFLSKLSLFGMWRCVFADENRNAGENRDDGKQNLPARGLRFLYIMTEYEGRTVRSILTFLTFVHNRRHVHGL